MNPLAPAVKSAGPRLLADLPDIDDEIAAWLERSARRAEQQAAAWFPAAVAEIADDRRRLLDLAGDGSLRRETSDDTGALPAGALEFEPPPLGDDADPTVLVWTREDNSTLDAPLARFCRAIRRIDEAFSVLEQRLTTAHDEIMAGSWHGSALLRADAIERKLLAVRRRRESIRACVTGRVRLVRFRCCDGGACGNVQHGVPAGCNSRFCPACVRKMRRQGMARVHHILGAVDARRHEASGCRCGRVPGARCTATRTRWRLVTLTARSWGAFRPMRQFLGNAWGRLLRRDLWADSVRACVAAWETTHTAKGWHVHVHAAVDAFLERRQLVRTWQQAQAAGLVDMIAAGWSVEGAPGDVAAIAEACRSDEQRREDLRAATRRLCRFAEAWRLELDEALAPAPPVRRAPHKRATDAALGKAMRRAHRALLAEPAAVRGDLRAIVDAIGNGAGVDVRDFGDDRDRLVSEMAKYLGKDLGGAQVDDAGEWGVAGTAERMAEFIDGAFRWRTLRTYGDAYDRDELEDEGGMECDACGGPVEYDGTAWLEDDQAAAVAAREADRRRERKQFRAEQRAAFMAERPSVDLKRGTG